MLVKYLRDEHGKKFGAVVAIGRGQLGWSCCKITKDGKQLDRFDKELALKIAEGRAKTGSTVNVANPAVIEALAQMDERANRYYKASGTQRMFAAFRRASEQLNGKLTQQQNERKELVSVIN